MIRSFVAPRPKTIALAVAAALLALAAWQLTIVREGAPTAHAAVAGVTMNMKVTDRQGTLFKGDDNASARNAGLITVTAFQLDLISPRDPATGQATGRRQWKPIVVTHLVDGASPQLLGAAARNEDLKSVVVNFYRTDRTGKLDNFYRVTLTDATVSEVHQYTSGLEVLEDDSFFFQKIQVDELSAHTSFSDTFVEVT